MSAVSYHVCDHCGKKLNAMEDWIEQEIMINTFINIDLCADCYNEFQNVVFDFLNMEE